MRLGGARLFRSTDVSFGSRIAPLIIGYMPHDVDPHPVCARVYPLRVKPALGSDIVDIAARIHLVILQYRLSRVA